MYLWTSESVSDGHPDKVADQISDAILDAYLAEDPQAKVACDVAVTRDFILIAGEVKSRQHPDAEQVARATLADIGYASEETGLDARTCEIVNKLHEQSPEINKAVEQGEELGAGDQGLMFGFATNETRCHMPLAIYLARQILDELRNDRKTNPDSPLLPDAKSQVTLALNDDGTLDHVHTLVVSTCHQSGIGVEQIRDYVRALIQEKMLPRLPEQDVAGAFGRAKYIINPSGEWTLGGPAADTGLTGRKVVVDNYGADCPVGGGAFSGKDCSKVDRSGAYAARHIAKNLVAAGLGNRVLVQLAYVIGVVEPVGLSIRDCDGQRDLGYAERVRETVPLTPRAMIERFHLDRPIFLPTAAGGHFGREPSGDFFGWEKLNLVETFRS
jgi:S-adenosylmethionine synthetase